MTEHEEMMLIFQNRVGSLSDYVTQEEKNLWFSWLGVFVMGWDAYRSYLGNLKGTE
jgi:hypothetical protein